MPSAQPAHTPSSYLHHYTSRSPVERPGRLILEDPFAAFAEPAIIQALAECVTSRRHQLDAACPPLSSICVLGANGRLNAPGVCCDARTSRVRRYRHRFLLNAGLMPSRRDSTLVGCSFCVCVSPVDLTHGARRSTALKPGAGVL
jgi:hypothetical protein